jgi:hypothetical protein
VANIIVGGCLCGTVTFQISGEFESFFLCHCRRCRKDTGSAHAANLFSSSAQITWISGQKSIKTFQLPGTKHQKSFCTECGSALPSVHLGGTMLVAPAGCLDSEITIRPNAHICTASRADWDQYLEQTPMLDGLPG